jgi:hypothetical protein
VNDYSMYVNFLREELESNFPVCAALLGTDRCATPLGPPRPKRAMMRRSTVRRTFPGAGPMVERGAFKMVFWDDP